MFTCNLCACNQNQLLFQEESPLAGHSFSVVKCKDCGLVTTFPQPTDSFLTKLYNLDSYQAQTVSGQYCLNQEASEKDFNFILNKMSGLAKGRKLLDVGCGAGNFLRHAVKDNWDCHGIEPSPYASKIAKKHLGERVTHGFFNEQSYSDASFDAVTLWYVLEHVPDPSKILTDCKRILKSDGVIFIAVPNWHYIKTRRLLSQIKQGSVGIVHAHEHLFQFSSNTLKRMFEKNGFQSVSEHCATPYMVSGPFVNFLKTLTSLPISILHSVFGVNLGGILMIGRIDGTPS